MKASVQHTIDLLIKKARTEQKTVRLVGRPTRSSLHKVIRTPAQAARFMKMLKSADQK